MENLVSGVNVSHSSVWVHIVSGFQASAAEPH